MPLPLWWEESGSPYAARRASAPAAPSDDPSPATSDPLPPAADVAIVGGGFTGLWTAFYLLAHEPRPDVVVLEAEHVGFGASGRNGGWASALWPVAPGTIARHHGEAAARSLLAALRDTVVEVGDVTATEGIECGYRRGGMLTLARSSAQVARARAEVTESEHWDLGTVWLGPAQARERLDATDVHGATFNPHCARVHPRRLVDGLAAAVRARGGRILERTAVRDVEPGRVHLRSGGVLRAGHVIRATEAWTPTLPRLRRALAPVYSLMVATEPLSAELWSRIGLADREVFADHRHVVIYGQRTVDDRLAFGGRGAPYHFGSRVRPEFDDGPKVFADLRATLTNLLPQLEGVAFTHAWGGAIAISRDWHPSVGYDRRARIGWAGGYVGDGVAASNLAGRTLADLVTGRHTPITNLAWVGHRSPRWEPEPARWLGINAGLRLAQAADWEESRTGRPAVLARALSTLTGH